MLPIPGVYMIHNNLTKRAYVGSSQNVRRRCLDHVRQLNAGLHPDRSLQTDWRSNGPAAFTFTLLDPTDSDNARLARRELQWQERLRDIGIGLYGTRLGGRSTENHPLPGLRRLRILAALSQGDLAQQAGIQRQTVNRLEHGGEAEMATVRKLADALKCEPRDLIGELPDQY